MDADLRALRAALDRRTAPLRLWWRDDDAGRDDPRLERLLETAALAEAPLTLAVVPAWLEAAAAARIRAAPGALVAQHGWAHDDHARAGGRPIELGGTVERASLLRDLGRGRDILARAFGPRLVPVMVPPWNRIDADVADRLPALGHVAVSTIAKPGAPAPPATGLPRLDVHLDLVDWPARRALDPGAAAARLTAAATTRAPALGLMTHHLVTDDAGFAALRALLAALRGHPAVRFVTLADLLPLGAAA